MKYQVTFNVKESKKDSYDTFQRIISFPNIDKLAHAMDHLIRSILFEECSIILDSQQGWTFDIHNGEVTMDWRKVDGYHAEWDRFLCHRHGACGSVCSHPLCTEKQIESGSGKLDTRN